MSEVDELIISLAEYLESEAKRLRWIAKSSRDSERLKALTAFSIIHYIPSNSRCTAIVQEAFMGGEN